MKWWIVGVHIVGAAFLLYLALVYMPHSSAPSKEATLFATTTLTTEGFVPNELYVLRGGTVVFINQSDHPFWPASNLHPDHSIYSEFDPREPIDVGKEWAFVFEKPGIWGFHDHVRSYYTGIVHVSE